MLNLLRLLKQPAFYLSLAINFNFGLHLASHAQEITVEDTEIADVEVPNPEGDCFRTANDSCSQYVALPQNNVNCGLRICTVLVVPIETKDEDGNIVIVNMKQGLCITPAHEDPFTHEIAAREVPNVKDISEGNGWKGYLAVHENDGVKCIIRRKCGCTVNAGENGDFCGLGDVMDEVGTVYGWITDTQSETCPDDSGEAGPQEPKDQPATPIGA